MRFVLNDEVLAQSEDRIVAVKHVTMAEEYLADHFPTFPVLPGVLMVEAMVQAARRLLSARTRERLVLGEVRAVKFGSMVRPGETLEVEVTVKESADGTFACRGTGRVRRDRAEHDVEETAVSGRFTMRPVRAG